MSQGRPAPAPELPLDSPTGASTVDDEAPVVAPGALELCGAVVVVAGRVVLVVVVVVVVVVEVVG